MQAIARVLAIASMTVAQIAPPPNTQTAPPVAPPAAFLTAPASIGRAHVCDETMYPVSAMQTGTEGETLLAFTITPTGSVAGVVVLQSSGNADLDTAAAACALQWQYRPALREGIPVETSWKAIVKWQIRPVWPFAQIAGAAKACIRATDEGREELRRAPLHPVFRIHYTNGTIAAVELVGSSGDGDLDQRATECFRNVPQELTQAVPGDQVELTAIYP